MRVPHKTTIIGSIIIGSLLLLLAVGRVSVKISEEKTYNVLEEAVAVQAFASRLDKPQHVTVECYPEGRSSTCLALRYIISHDVCQKIAQDMDSTITKNGCTFTQKSKPHNGSAITYVLGKNSVDEYVLNVWKY